jgi:hypothetical protein
MKQYLTGFLTALFFCTSIYFYIKSSTILENRFLKEKIVLEGESGKTIIHGGKIILLNKENQIVVSLSNSAKNSGNLTIYNHLGYNIIDLGAHYGDGMSGNGIFNINNQNGEYSWSVIGRVSEEQYQ